MLIDHAIVYLKAGKGGNGCESFENRGPRKLYPNGGDGGKGGDIIIRADSNVRDLEFFKYNPVIESEKGKQGSSNKNTGKCGKDYILKVPVGTVIMSRRENYLIRDLSVANDEVIVVRGGRQGRGNHDNKTQTHGKEGEELEIILDYKIKSDIAIIGTPNSGKSTLLAYLTSAKVKTHEYPFSTHSPQLGSFELEDYTQLIMCDLPSLIEGSSRGKGVGNLFLKHAERARLIFYVIDPNNSFTGDIVDSFNVLQKEVGHYSQDILKKPFIVLINKSDIADSEEIKKSKDRLKKMHKYVYNISALKGEGIKPVISKISEVVKKRV